MLIDFLTIFHLIKFLVDVILQIASHLPYNRNGFKFFTNAGGLGKADIKIILERAADIYKSFTDQGLLKSKRKASESIKRVDYMTVYTSDLVKAVRKAAENIGKCSETVVIHELVNLGMLRLVHQIFLFCFIRRLSEPWST
jgi:phosphomannomutase